MISKKEIACQIFFFRVLQKVALFCCALFYFFLRGVFLWTFSLFEGHHLLYLTVVLLKQLTGLLKLLWVPCQPKVYIFNPKFRGKFFHFVVPFFSKQKHGGFILSPLTALYFFLWAFPSFFWSVKGAFFRCPFLALFLVRFMWHSLTATVEKKITYSFWILPKKGLRLIQFNKIIVKKKFYKKKFMVTVSNGSKSMVKGDRFTHGPIWWSRSALSYVPILTEQREVPEYSHGPFYPS